MMRRTPLTNETNCECVQGEICPRFWWERRRLPDSLSKVVSVVSQWHVGNVASAVTQLLCQHSSDSVIFLWPLGAQWTQVCNAPYKKGTNSNRKWRAMTGKGSARKLRKAQGKCQRCFVWNSTGTGSESLGLHSASSLTWHFTTSVNVSS